MTATPKPLQHSFSSIKLFENCPLRYYHQRIKKSVVDKGGEASQYGERIHSFLEKRIKREAALPQEITHYEPVIGAMEAVLTDAHTLLAEQEMSLTKDLTPTGWWDSDVWMRSKIDVLGLRQNAAVVLDWKTGKRRTDFTQLELFALQVFAHYPQVNEVVSTFVWLKDLAIDKEVYKRDQAPSMWASLIERVNRIEDAAKYDRWPAKPSGLCKFCPCRAFCDYAV